MLVLVISCLCSLNIGNVCRLSSNVDLLCPMTYRQLALSYGCLCVLLINVSSLPCIGISCATFIIFIHMHVSVHFLTTRVYRICCPMNFLENQFLDRFDVGNAQPIFKPHHTFYVFTKIWAFPFYDQPSYLVCQGPASSPKVL